MGGRGVAGEENKLCTWLSSNTGHVRPSVGESQKKRVGFQRGQHDFKLRGGEDPRERHLREVGDIDRYYEFPDCLQTKKFIEK